MEVDGLPQEPDVVFSFARTSRWDESFIPREYGLVGGRGRESFAVWREWSQGIRQGAFPERRGQRVTFGFLRLSAGINKSVYDFVKELTVGVESQSVAFEGTNQLRG